MQINNQAVSSQVNTHEKPLELKKGEIYSATIKERTSRDEAMLQIRGREVQVKFDAKAPTQDRITVQVAGESEGKIQVRTIAEAPRYTSASPQTERTNTDQTLRSLGVSNPSQQLRQAAQMVLDKGVPLTRDSVQDLRAFVEKEKGTVQQRLNTVQAVANKRLDVTTNHLRSVHEALHGRPLNEVLTNIAKDLDPNFKITREQSEVVNNPRGEREVARQVERTLTQTQPLVQNSQAPLQNQQEQQGVKPTEALKQMKSTVQKEGDFQKATSELRNQIEQAPFERPTKELITKSLEEANRLQDQGRELAARQQLMQSFIAVEPQVARLDHQAIQPEMQQYSINEAFQTQQLTSKDLIVQTITEKLAKAQADFKSLQREITRNLDNIQHLTEAFKSQAPKQVKPLLETTIKRLDNAILKSEMMLLTDMKTEKKLMQASSRLAEAKKLLNRGNYQEANRIVQEIKTMIEKLEFKPSDTKVKHFITKEEQNLQSRAPSQQLLQQYDDLSRRPTTQDFSARQAFELVRGLGLNRDSEVAQMLATGRQGDGEPNQNMKNALMQLMKMEEEQGRVSQQTNQALANITGQQLLSKSDTNSNLQSMFFNLPFLLEDEVRDLQVFVNSRNEGEKVDWENCNLYFLIETKKLGEVGILVTVTDGSLSLTIKNDQPHFKERIEPLAELCRENLKEVGYNISSLNFTKLTAVQTPDSEIKGDQEHQEKMTPTFTEKGFDFKI